MPKSAEAATRFTSTTPHATSKATSRPATASVQANRTRSGPSSGPLPNRTPGPVGETPQEKVARLRAAAAKSKAANASTFDQVIVRARVWADRAHRFTALSLIGLTGIAGVVTVYALGDMIIYNRRKRAEYFTEQRALQNAQLHDAQRAMSAGVASEEQIAFVEEEVKIQNWVKEKKEKKGVFTKGKEWLFSGLKKEDDGIGGSTTTDDTSSSVKDEMTGNVSKVIEEKKEAVKGLATEAYQQAYKKGLEEEESQRTGGPLDRLGTIAADDAKSEQKSGGGWTSFMTRR